MAALRVKILTKKNDAIQSVILNPRLRIEACTHDRNSVRIEPSHFLTESGSFGQTRGHPEQVISAFFPFPFFFFV